MLTLGRFSLRRLRLRHVVPGGNDQSLPTPAATDFLAASRIGHAENGTALQIGADDCDAHINTYAYEA